MEVGLVSSRVTLCSLTFALLDRYADSQGAAGLLGMLLYFGSHRFIRDIKLYFFRTHRGFQAVIGITYGLRLRNLQHLPSGGPPLKEVANLCAGEYSFAITVWDLLPPGHCGRILLC